MGVQLLDNGIAILEEGGAIVSHRIDTNPINPIGRVETVTSGNGQSKIMGWGEDNDLPARRERLVTDNNIVPSLLATRRDITLGQGLMAYTERFEEQKGRQVRVVDEVPIPDIAADFFEMVDIDTCLRQAANNLMFHGMIFPEFTRKKRGDLSGLQILQCRHVRAEEMDKFGKINNWYWSGNWGHQRDKKRKALPQETRIPTYNSTKTQGKFILPLGDDLLCVDEYYFTPYWWGSEEWIRLANCIPAFHQANINHGYSIRYHIEIPKDYFADKTAAGQTDELRKKMEAAESAAKKDFLDKLNKFLAGVTKAGRSVVTEYEINKAAGKEFPGIKITPLKVDLQDKALLELFEKSNQANISSQGVHPTLANIETQGKLSSGSEIRNAFLMYVAIKTPLPRKLLLKIIDFAKMDQGWSREIKFGFRDMDITKLDEDKTGSKETVRPND